MLQRALVSLPVSRYRPVTNLTLLLMFTWILSKLFFKEHKAEGHVWRVI